MAYGPLVTVRTQVAGIRLDTRRTLNYPPNTVLALVVPDGTEVGGWRTIKALTRGFNRIGAEETDRRDGHSVIFRIADLDGETASALRTKDVYVLFQEAYYKVNSVPKVPPDVAQVYDVACATRTLKQGYFDNAR
jgi:hypothetical protein